MKGIYPIIQELFIWDKWEHDVIAEYLNCADIFVSPTLAEGCSNSIVEAMACGLPIISSDLPFNHDILDEKNSILLDPVEVNEIALAIRKNFIIIASLYDKWEKNP